MIAVFVRNNGGCAFALLLAVAMLGCQSEPEKPGENRGESSPNKAARLPSFQPMRDLPGLHNIVKVSDRIFSGSEPEGEDAFSRLAGRGAKTIISVDGARPNVEAAHKAGLRYVHIPMGYDGISERAAAALTRAGKELEGSIYVHCHHGRHRGPAAAVIIAIAAGELDPSYARTVLELSGTGKEYKGLWRDVAGYKDPPPETELPELVEIAEVDSLTAAMVQIDRHWDRLKLCRNAGWRPPKKFPDLDAAHEALQLREALHEAARMLAEEKFDGQFREWLAEAERQAGEIEMNLGNSNPAEAERLSRLLQDSCKQCHERYRN